MKKDINSYKLNSETYFEAIKTGALKINKDSGLIKIIDLDKYIKYCTNHTNLGRAIAYSMVFPVYKRNNLEWQMTFSCLPNKNKEFWQNIASISLVQKPHKLNQLICINYSILRENRKEDFFKKHPSILNIILTELRLLGNG